MLRTFMLAGATVVLFIGSAAAQPAAQTGGSPVSIPYNSEQPPTPEEIEKRKATDRAYNAAMQKIPDKKPSADPWGTIRPTSPTASKNKQQ
jgi:hypothetical protein